MIRWCSGIIRKKKTSNSNRPAKQVIKMAINSRNYNVLLRDILWFFESSVRCVRLRWMRTCELLLYYRQNNNNNNHRTRSDAYVLYYIYLRKRKENRLQKINF